jgi:peptide/nickel transport system substrate-binding protein
MEHIVLRNKYIFFLSVLILAGIILVACNTTEEITLEPTTTLSVAQPTKIEPTQAPSGPSGTVTVGIASDFLSIDPQINLMRTDSSIFYINIYDRLVWYDFDGNILPRLLISWKNLSDTEWELKLREGVTFHNGEPWNAEAFVWNWTRVLDSGKPRHARMEALAKYSAEIIDEYTVKVTTTEPHPMLIGEMYNFFMLPPKYIQEVGDDAFGEKPIGTGPFKFVEWVKGDHLTLEANSDYWGGEPKIKTLIFKPIPEVATRISALQVGEVDVIAAVPPDMAASIINDPNLKIADAPINGVIYIELFPDSPVGGGKPLNDKRVRQALIYATDRQAIVDYIYQGYGDVRAGIISSQAFGFDPDLEPYPYDPVKAQELLAEAGWPKFTIQFDMASLGVASDLQVLQAVVADWEKIGITVKVNQMEQSPFLTRKLDWTIAPIFNWNFYAFDADYVVYKQCHSGEAWFYYAGWTPEIDEMLEAQQVEMDPDTRLAIWKEFQARFKDDAPYVPLFQPRSIYGLNNQVLGFEPEPNDTMFFGNVYFAGE